MQCVKLYTGVFSVPSIAGVSLSDLPADQNYRTAYNSLLSQILLRPIRYHTSRLVLLFHLRTARSNINGGFDLGVRLVERLNRIEGRRASRRKSEKVLMVRCFCLWRNANLIVVV